MPDSLKIDPYYKGLAQFIQETETPLTISIQGEWGSGKTSALKNIEEIIASEKEGGLAEFCDQENDKRNCHVIWFHTWQYSCLGVDDNLILALFTHLKSELEKLILNKEERDTPQNDKKNRTVEKITKAFLKGGAKVAFDSVGIGGLFDAAAELINNIAKSDDVPQLTEVITTLKAVIEKMIDEVVPDGKRLVIFVDDLDRLEPKVAVELLSGIKNILDCKKCVFVLAVDKEVIISGVKEKYGAFYNDDKKANQFFDKLIQVPFSLPTQKYDIQYLLETDYQKDMPEGWVKEYVRVVHELFQNNPRSIERAFHSFRLHKLILTEVKSDEDVYNLFVILAFQLRDEESYKKLVELSNDLEELSLFLKGEKSNDGIKIPIGEYLKLPSCPFSNIKKRVINDENQEEEEKWRKLFSLLRKLPEGPLTSETHQLFFSEGMYHIIQIMRESPNYTMEINKDKCWCEFFDKREHKLVLRFEEKGENKKERLLVYKTKPDGEYQNGFDSCGCTIHTGKEHITILSDELETKKQFDKLETFLSKTMELF